MTATLYRHQFGTAEFDQSRMQLRVGGVPVELQSKPLELLALLLATPGELVRKADILDVLWKDVSVVPAVLPNAASKLRAALGPRNAGFIVTVARHGYRFEGDLQRLAVGRRLTSALALAPGMAVPGRAGHRLMRQLGASPRNETWLAEQPKTGDRRVYKFALDGERLADLKREFTIGRVLRETLGERSDLTRVLDANFEAAPFWLEYEDAGDDLDTWAAERVGEGTRLQGLARAERLAIVLRIADALAAAHSALVSHGDLKPANVLLMASAGGGWQVRLGDFGSGRLLAPEQLERLRITLLGLTLDSADSSSGTPYYIAPELLRGGKPVPTSDVFSLGVMLYQLIVGDLRRPLAPGWERDIDDELLREDIAQATDIDPRLRTNAAAVLAERLRRLGDRRAQQEAERMRAELARQREERAALARRNEVATALNRLLREDLIGAANPAASGRADISVADALTGAAERIDSKYAELSSAVRGSLHASMQAALSELSRAQEAVLAGQRAVDALAAAARDGAHSAAETGESTQALQSARLLLALDLVHLSRLDEARRVMAELDAAAGPPAAQDRLFRARRLFVQSWITGGDFSFEASLRELEQAFALVEAMSEAQAPWRAKIAFALADNLALLGRLEASEALYRRLLDEQRRDFGDTHARTLYTGVGLGSVLARRGQHAEAHALLENAALGLAQRMGPRHRHTLTAIDMLADLRFRQGDCAGAAADWAEVQAGYAALTGEGSSYTITAQTNRALALHRGGDAAAAEALLRDGLLRSRDFIDDASPQLQQIRYALAECLLDLGRHDEAAALSEGLSAPALNLAQPEGDWPERLDRLAQRLGAVATQRP